MLLASIIAFAVVIERLIFLGIERLRRNEKGRERILEALDKGMSPEPSRSHREARTTSFGVIHYAITRKDQSIAHALQYAQLRKRSASNAERRCSTPSLRWRRSSVSSERSRA
jgi:hypothetical protein